MRPFRNYIEKAGSQEGWTLLELVVVIVLIGVVAGMVSNFIVYGLEMYSRLSDRTEKIQNSRTTLQVISRDIRQIIAPDSIFQASEDSIRFDDINHLMISYQFFDNQIIRNGDLLQNSVDDFQVEYYDDSGNLLASPVTDPSVIRTVTITFSTSIKGQPLTLNATIRPRIF